jgi:hypothetical protein
MRVSRISLLDLLTNFFSLPLELRDTHAWPHAKCFVFKYR